MNSYSQGIQTYSIYQVSTTDKCNINGCTHIFWSLRQNWQLILQRLLYLAFDWLLLCSKKSF